MKQRRTQAEEGELKAVASTWSVVLCADWSKDRSRREVYAASPSPRRVFRLKAPSGGWTVEGVVERAEDLRDGGRPPLVGFDAPIGVPRSYLEAARSRSFAAWLCRKGDPRRFDPCGAAAKWSVERPFFGVPAGAYGLTSFQERMRASGVAPLREIERRTGGKSVFVVHGVAGAVGSSAIDLWRGLSACRKAVALWPFDGDLHALGRGRKPVLAEIYPRLAYGLAIGTAQGHVQPRLVVAKTSREVRRAFLQTMLGHEWIRSGGVTVEDVEEAVGSEDAFDALVTAAALLRCLLEGRRLSDGSEDGVAEGGILGSGSVDLDGPERRFQARPPDSSRAGGGGAYSPLLDRTHELALDYLDRLPDAPVAATATLVELRRRLDRPLPAEGREPTAVIEQLVADVSGGLHASAGGRFFGWVIGGSVPAAVAADWLTSAWDQCAGMFAVAPAAAVVEEVCGRWLLELLGLPATASFALVTGCQMAHVTCLAAARNAVLARHGWDVEQKGLFGAPAIRVVSGDQRHGTIERALRLLGLGRDSVVDIPVDGKGLTAAALDPVLVAARGVPTIVLLQAGDLNTGAFDPFPDVIPVAHEHGAWVHVDGAFGMWAATSPEHRHLTTGVGQADSWATDGHKWLNVPYDCGYAIVADREAHWRSFAHRVAYLNHSDVARDAVDWNPEYSRRARGFATYAAIASLGREGIGRLVADCCRQARAIVDGAGALPGVQVLCRPVINQGLLRFLDPRPGATEADHDRRTEALAARIVASGEALFACTTWRGMRCMRVSVSGWATTDADVERTVRAIAAAAGR